MSITVAIVGSKPAPVLPNQIDILVCCNGSVYLLDRLENRPPEVWHCITNSALYEAQGGSDLVRSQLNGRSVDLMVEITTLPEHMLDHSWESVGYSFGNRDTISKDEKGELSFSVLNRFFYWDLLWAPCPAREKISAFWNYFWRKKKPAASTGILALLYALKRKGAEGATFVLCGIGLANDGYELSKRAAPRGHICMDYCVLKALSRASSGRKVLVSDKQLAELVGLPLMEA